MDIRKSRKRLNLLFPRIEKLTFNIGFADVIQDELDVRTLFYKSNRVGELRMENTEVETQSIVGKHSNAAYKVGLDAEINAFGLDESTDTFHEWILRQFFDERRDLFPSSSGAQATIP